MLGLFPPTHKCWEACPAMVTRGQSGWEAHPSKQLQGSAVQTLKSSTKTGHESATLKESKRTYLFSSLNQMQVFKKDPN